MALITVSGKGQLCAGEMLIDSVWRRDTPKADGSRERSEPWSEGGGCGWLCYPLISPKPERREKIQAQGWHTPARPARLLRAP